MYRLDVAYLFERRQVAGAVPNAFLKAREKAPWIDGWYAVASSQQDQLGAMVVQKSIRHHYQAGTGPTQLSGNDGFEL